MKTKIILSSVALATLFIFSCNNASTSKNDVATENFDTTKLKTGEAYYQCEMHPEVMSAKEGKCPKCGEMELTKQEKK